MVSRTHLQRLWLQAQNKGKEGFESVNVLIVFGTRPEAIKMAPVVLGLQADARLNVSVCVTAQHREMLDQVLSIFAITPDYDLNLMKPNQDLYDVTSGVLLGLRDVLRSKPFDLVLVHGDTTTCMAAGLAAFYEGIKVGHVEAGLRTGDLSAPFPEEANRSIVARLCSMHFAPTDTSRQNLINENVHPENIFVTGNTVIDALLMARDMTEELPASHWKNCLGARVVERIAQCEKHILITGHRRENFGEGFVNLCEAIKEVAAANPAWLLTYPVHLNPNVRKPVNDILAGLDNVQLIEPQDYLPFVWLMNNSHLILTDSGGIQEEGPSLGKPVLVMREVTERPEAVDAGTVKLVGTNRAAIVSAVTDVLSNKATYHTMSRAINPYGDGNAVSRIIDVICRN